MGDIYDADIQKAPVYPVMFEIEQEKETVHIIDPQQAFIIRCSVYVPAELRRGMQEYEHFMYATLFDSGQPISQKIGTIKPSDDQKNIILQIAISFEPVKIIDNNKLNLQMAITSKHKGESGIGESLRTGRFINTYIPLENKNE